MPGRRAPTTSIPGMSPTYHASSASTPMASSASRKMRGSGFITPTAPESITQSTSTPTPGPTCSSSRSRRRSPIMPSAFDTMPSRTPVAASSARPVAAPGRLPVPERGVGELAVEVEVHLLAEVGGHAALVGVALEVGRPARGPVGFGIEVDAEARRRGVVRVVERRRQ